MRGIEPPVIDTQMSSSWMQRAGESFRCPEYLWHTCWRQFNTIELPILGRDAFEKVANDCARKTGKDGTKEEFETAFEDDMTSILKKLLSQRTRVGTESISRNHQLPKGMSKAVIRFCREPTIEAMATLLEVASGLDEEDAQTTHSDSSDDTQDDSDYSGTQVVDTCCPIPSDHPETELDLDPHRRRATETPNRLTEEASKTNEEQGSKGERLLGGDGENDTAGASTVPFEEGQCSALPSPCVYKNVESLGARPATPEYEEPTRNATSFIVSPPISSCSDLSAKESSSQVGAEPQRKRKRCMSDDEDEEEHEEEQCPLKKQK